MTTTQRGRGEADARVGDGARRHRGARRGCERPGRARSARAVKVATGQPGRTSADVGARDQVEDGASLAESRFNAFSSLRCSRSPRAPPQASALRRLSALLGSPRPPGWPRSHAAFAAALAAPRARVRRRPLAGVRRPSGLVVASSTADADLSSSGRSAPSTTAPPTAPRPWRRRGCPPRTRSPPWRRSRATSGSRVASTRSAPRTSPALRHPAAARALRTPRAESPTRTAPASSPRTPRDPPGRAAGRPGGARRGFPRRVPAARRRRGRDGLPRAVGHPERSRLMDGRRYSLGRRRRQGRREATRRERTEPPHRDRGGGGDDRGRARDDVGDRVQERKERAEGDASRRSSDGRRRDAFIARESWGAGPLPTYYCDIAPTGTFKPTPTPMHSHVPPEHPRDVHHPQDGQPERDRRACPPPPWRRRPRVVGARTPRRRRRGASPKTTATGPAYRRRGSCSPASHTASFRATSHASTGYFACHSRRVTGRRTRTPRPAVADRARPSPRRRSYVPPIPRRRRIEPPWGTSRAR